MSLLGDARRLADSDGLVFIDGYDDHDYYCPLDCNASDRHQDHNCDCPWLALPKIVAVLEAAERFANNMIRDTFQGACGEISVYVCGACGATASWEPEKIEHWDDCVGQTLKMLLHGKEARP